MNLEEIKNIPPNPHGPKPRPAVPVAGEPKPATDAAAKKTISGSAHIKEPTGVKKVLKQFIVGDFTSIMRHVGENMLIPAAKKFMLETINTVASMALTGEPWSSRTTSGSSTERYYRSYDEARREPRRASATPKYNFGDILFDRIDDVEFIIDSMNEYLDEYGSVSVGYFYELARLGTTKSDYNYGWTDLSSAGFARTVDGYVIKLPQPKPLP